MKNIENHKIPIASGAISLAVGLVTKHVFKWETIKVNTLGNSLASFASFIASAIIAEQMYKNIRE